MLPSQTAEEQIQTVTSTPMEAISIDLGKQAGVHYLIGADRYSGWPFVTKLSSLVTQTITSSLDDWFLEHGRPQRIRSDGGSQFRTEFEEWCKSRNIVHEKSSAYHHESNGHAEVAVREMKHLLEKTGSWKKFQMDFQTDFRTDFQTDFQTNFPTDFLQDFQTDHPVIIQLFGTMRFRF